MIYRRALDNAMGCDDVASLLAKRFYDAEKIEQGKRKLEGAEKLYMNQRMAVARARGTQSDYEKKRGIALREYMFLLDICRKVAGGDRYFIRALGLSGKRRTRFPYLAEQMRRFYVAALTDPEVARKLEEESVEKESLEKGFNALQDAVGAWELRTGAKGAKEQSRKDRDRAMADLDKWMAVFYRVSKAATRRKPQLMEKLGVTVRSDDYRRGGEDRRKSPEDADAGEGTAESEPEPEAEAETEDNGDE